MEDICEGFPSPTASNAESITMQNCYHGLTDCRKRTAV